MIFQPQPVSSSLCHQYGLEYITVLQNKNLLTFLLPFFSARDAEIKFS